jgi:hypothetical protein
VDNQILAAFPVYHSNSCGLFRLGLFQTSGDGHQAGRFGCDKDKTSFGRQNDTRHTDNKFDGFVMKMVRLKSGDNETIVVFRSQHRT